jgi:hypothetical protein
MKARHREILVAESGRHLESMLKRFSQVTELVPWLRPGLSHSDLRRTAARLRDGTIVPTDPRVSPSLLADLIEKSVAQEELVMSVAKEAEEYKEISRSLHEKDEAERKKRSVARFHRLKKSPEASNPESTVAERVGRIGRTRRKELGRPRGRNGKKSK